MVSYVCCMSVSSFKILLITVVNQLTHVHMHQMIVIVHAVMSFTLSIYYKSLFKTMKSNFKKNERYIQIGRVLTLLFLRCQLLFYQNKCVHIWVYPINFIILALMVPLPPICMCFLGSTIGSVAGFLPFLWYEKDLQSNINFPFIALFADVTKFAW